LFLGTNAGSAVPAGKGTGSSLLVPLVEKKEDRRANLSRETLRLKFGDCSFDMGTRGLLRSGRPVPLSDRASALLRVLLRQSPQPATNEELASALWPETASPDGRIAGLILELRGAIERAGEAEMLQRTSAPDGYAIAASVAEDRRPVVPGLGYRYCLFWDDREIPLEKGENVIGRDRETHLQIDERDVSRRHALVVIEGDHATLQDLGSSNGTFCNDRRVEKPVTLSDGDRIAVGPVHLVYRERATS
jgi:DNA-binding winged helix-turn-helix (wHTH) protein